MMVSKIAVTALVIIVACPILLGYAMNLTETTETNYAANGEAVNVTPLLRTSVDYNYAAADAFQINSMARYAGSKVLPLYEKITTAKTSFPLTMAYEPSWLANGTISLGSVSIYGINAEYDHLNYSINFDIKDSSNNTLFTVNNFETMMYIASENTVYFTYYNSGGIGGNAYINSNIASIAFSHTGSFTATPMYYYIQNKTGNTKFVDISAGFHFEDYNYSDNVPFTIWLPAGTIKTILTVDLDSITASNYTFGVNELVFKKTTTGGVVEWSVKFLSTGSYEPIYYNTSGDNVYQIYSEHPNSNDLHDELRYVGSWPTLIGEANYYQKYTFDASPGGLLPYQNIAIHDLSAYKSPVMRMDHAEYLAFEQPIIENQTYHPGDFKSNPQTTISNVDQYGSSLTFGGNTYTVTNGKITLGTREIPVNDLEFSSEPDGNGAYINKIGNTIISTSADPSTITFNGKWAASISTKAMESYTVTKTSWTAGEFGWDGIDQNFLFVGLLTTLGVFIALGIYIRRTRAALWPLLIVCGGAAALFFIML